MENPASWKSAELLILDALEDHDRYSRMGAVGYSTPALIASRLRQAGLLRDQDEPEIGWDKLRAHRAERHTEHEQNTDVYREQTDAEAAADDATWD